MRKLLALLIILTTSAFAQINNGGGGGAGGGPAVQVNGSTTGIATTANFVPNPFSSYAGLALGSYGTSINVNGTFPQGTNIYIFGDSTDTVLQTQNGDSVPPTGMNGLSGYAGQIISNAAPGVGDDWAVSGDQWEDATVRIFTHLSDWWLASNATGQYQSATVIVKQGINNAASKPSSTYQTTITRPSIYAALTAAALHSQSVTFGQAAGCVKTGSWSTDNTTFVTASSPAVTITGIAAVSQTNGDTIACPITTTSNSPVGVIWYGMVDSNLGTFTLSSSAGACTDVVTGGTTIDAFGGATISTHNGTTVTVGAALCPLTAGAYTMTATINTGSSGSTKKVWILGMGALPAFPGHRSVVSPVLVGGTLRDRTDTNPTWTGNYDQEAMNAAARLSTAYNFPIQFVPVHTYTVATLPAAPVTGAIADVNDASTTTSCATGSGTNVIRCRYNGATWDAQIGGVPPVNMPTATGFFTDGLHPNRAGHALIYEQFAPFLPVRGSNNTTSLGFQMVGNATASTGSGAPAICLTGNNNLLAGGSLALGKCGSYGDDTGDLDISGGVARIGTINLYSASGGTLNVQCSGFNGVYCLFSSGARFGFTNGTGTSSEDITFDRVAAKVFGVSTTTPGDHDGMISAKGFLSPNVIHQTAKTAAITTATLCAAATGGCNVAGQYHISATIINTGTACTNVTAGSVGLNLTWTDSNGTTHTTVTVPLFTQASSTATAATMVFVANNLSAFASADFNISTNGTIIQYATIYTGCTTGTGTYQLDISVNKVQ